MQQLRDLVAALTDRAGAIAEVVERDLTVAAGSVRPARTARAAASGQSPAAAAGIAVTWLLGELAELGELGAGDRVRPVSLEPLRVAAGRAAAEGQPVGSVLDPYLSAGWAIWEAAAAMPDAGPALPALGGVLLRAGDAAAAAIAAAYADAEASLAARTASARREFLDELLAARPGDASAARVARRAPAYGLEPGKGLELVLTAAAGRELGDDDPEIGRFAAALGPRAMIVATDSGRALAVVRPGVVREAALRGALDAAFGPGGWTAIVAAADEGPAGVGEAAAGAHAALGIALRRGRRGTIEAPSATRLEQALLVDAAGLAEGVDAVLGPLASTPRTGDRLVATLRTFLEAAGNRHETARRLGLAPRTVAYRLRRIESRLGTRLQGEPLLRLAAALFARELLDAGDPDTSSEPARASGVRTRRGPARR
ncbi:MAG TPA: helix-turn-helix domain-containing protein [Candidatus Limnocylindrales bacterium]|nr:helix-turn-helix domain-containing protein [Candidatus Limnocylindrales bacterium]